MFLNSVRRAAVRDLLTGLGLSRNLVAYYLPFEGSQHLFRLRTEACTIQASERTDVIRREAVSSLGNDKVQYNSKDVMC